MADGLARLEPETGGEEKRSPHFRSSLWLRVGGRGLLRGVSGPAGAEGVESLRAAERSGQGGVKGRLEPRRRKQGSGPGGLEDWTLPTTQGVSREPRPRPARPLPGRRGCCAGARGSRGPPFPAGAGPSRSAGRG